MSERSSLRPCTGVDPETSGAAEADSPRQADAEPAGDAELQELRSVNRQLTAQLNKIRASEEWQYFHVVTEYLDAHPRLLSLVKRLIDLFASERTHEQASGANSKQRLLTQNGVFDAEWYRQRYQIGDEDPLFHFVTQGSLIGYSPHPLFDPDFYASVYEHDQSEHPAFGFAQMLQDGRYGNNPNPFLDLAWYAGANEDVRTSGLNPFVHYHCHGGPQCRQPSPLVPRHHLLHAQAAAKAGEYPLVHLLDETMRLRSSGPVSSESVLSAWESVFAAPGPPADVRFAVGLVAYDISSDALDQTIERVKHPVRCAEFEAACEGILIRNNGPQAMPQQHFERDDVQFENGENIGFAKAHNALMQRAFAAGADCYFCLNPDGFPIGDCLSQMLQAVRRNPDCLIEAMQFPDEHPKSFDLGTFETSWCAAACLAIPRRIHDAIGGFDKRFFLYCEDVDFSWRARAAGFRCLLCPSAQFYHDKSGRTAQGDGWRYVLMLKSGLYLAIKWNDRAFYDLCSKRLAARGEVVPEFGHGSWRDVQVMPRETRSVADFSHEFSFSEVRW